MGERELRVSLSFNRNDEDALRVYDYLKYKVGKRDKSKLITRLVINYLENGGEISVNKQEFKDEIKRELIQEIEEKLKLYRLDPSIPDEYDYEPKQAIEDEQLEAKKDNVTSKEFIQFTENIMDELAMFEP